MTDENAVKHTPTGKEGRFQSSLFWGGILLTYLVLFGVTGYIAFFQEPYNPATSPDESILRFLENEETRSHFLAALNQEGEAFKIRKELAGQSFNVVLGAILGFLSASAAHSAIRRHDSPGPLPTNNDRTEKDVT